MLFTVSITSRRSRCRCRSCRRCAFLLLAAGGLYSAGMARDSRNDGLLLARLLSTLHLHSPRAIDESKVRV